MKFEFSPNYQCLFLTGYAASPGGPTRLGVVVVKRTWQRVSASQSQPDPQQIPVQLADVPFNLVGNAGFDAPKLDPWEATGVTAALDPTNDVPKIVKLTGASGQLAQKIKFDAPLANRTFTFSLSVKTEPTAGNPNPSFDLSGTQLQAGSATGAAVSGKVSQALSRYKSTVTWSASVQDKEMQVVLGASGANDLDICYDMVQVEEFGSYGAGNPYFGEGEVVLESDLAIVKPRGDLIVLDFNAPDPGGALYQVTRSAAAQQATAVTGPAPVRTIFGWMPRSSGAPNDPRARLAGTNLKDFDKDTMKLPVNFDNLFFNGTAAAPAAAGGSDLTLDNASGIGADDLLRIDGDTNPAETEFSVVVSASATTKQVILATPLLFGHKAHNPVARVTPTAGGALAVETSRTMDVGGTELAVTDAAALTLAANEVVRVTDLDNASRVQYVVVNAAGSRTIRGAFRYTFDVNRVKIEPITPGPIAGEPSRSIAYAMPFSYFAPGETLTLRRLSPGGQADYAWKLPDAAPAASVTFKNASGQEQTLPVSLNLDTVVLFRHSDRFYTVWRGTWPYDRPDGRPASSPAVKDEEYVKLVVT